jgi:hypothetical protein
LPSEPASTWALPASRALSALSPDLINLFLFNSQPFQEALVAGWMTTLEQFMPLHPTRLIQTDLFEHGNPFVNIYVVFHFHFDQILLFGDSVVATATNSLKYEAIDGSTGHRQKYYLVILEKSRNSRQSCSRLGFLVLFPQLGTAFSFIPSAATFPASRRLFPGNAIEVDEI